MQSAAFLGLHIIRELLTLKAYIRAVVSSQDDVDAVTDTFPNHGKSLRVHLIPQPWLPGAHQTVFRDASHLVHIISPRTDSFEGDPDTDMLKPAIEGSLSIMQSAFEAHCLEKVVLISSATALGDWSLPPTEVSRPFLCLFFLSSALLTASNSS